MEQVTPHRVQIAQATDWKDAVVTLLEPRSPYRPWRYGAVEAQEGDSVAFVLNTDPPSVLTELARVRADGPPEAATFDHQLFQPNLLKLSILAEVLDVEPDLADSWRFDGHDAVKLDLTLTERCLGGAPDSRFGHNSMAAARQLLRFCGRCDGCEQGIDLSSPDARDRVFVHTVDLEPEQVRSDAVDWPAVLCRECTDRVGDATFLDYKFGLYPPCPECGARRTRATFYGMPIDFANIPPWSHAGGCCVSTEEWHCDVCDHEW
jgi:hypothetical protein